jgi:DNA polymerase-3 subunit delta'
LSLPLQFSDILGQDAAVEWLRQSYRAERLPHGLIFAGPAGVGKASTAAALGALFLCEKPQSDKPCGKCDSCRAMSAGNHPDFHEIYRQLVRLEKDTAKARDLSINVIRDFLVAPAGRKPVMGVGKVFVIEEAELMSPAAQNALLKTLEEPYGRALIILLTDAPGLLLPTIRSRCQLVSFASLDDKTVREELVKRGVARDVAIEAARFTGGSLGVALRWIDDGVITRAGELVAQLDELIRGKRAPDLPHWFKKSAEEYSEKQLKRDELSSKDQATREGLALYLKLAAEHFRMRLRELTDADEVEATCAAIDAVARAEQNLDANVNTPLTLQQFQVGLERALLFSPSPAGRGPG